MSHDDLAPLLADLERHDLTRPFPCADDVPRRGVCLALLAGPSELGRPGEVMTGRDEAMSLLNLAESERLPEARACRLWLQCAGGETPADAAETWEALARESLWEPVQALAFRALAHLGRRRVLAELLPSDGPLSMPQADAWLEATHSGEAAPLPRARLAYGGAWAMLVGLESILACALAPGDIPSGLEALLPPDDIDRERLRLCARVAAALTRARLEPGGDLRLLPDWERCFLQGAVHARQGDDEAALAALRESIGLNGEQTAPRLALAAILAHRGEPEAALDALACREPTRPVLISRAATLARLGRYDDCAAALDGLASAGEEPARLRWGAALPHYRAQQNMLLTALAERRGDWKTAEACWRAACDARSASESLQWSRRFFMAEAELHSSTASGWRRDTLQRKTLQAQQKIERAVLTGDDLFFRAMALSRGDPARAADEMRRLLRQRPWCEREKKVGGRRLLVVGDLFFRLDRLDDAIRAYELAGPSLAARERLGLVSILRQTRNGQPIDEPATAGPWSRLVAAVNLLIAGQREPALARIKAAEQEGAPAPLCRCLRLVIEPGSEAPVEPDEIDGLRLPAEADAIVRALAGAGDDGARLAALARTLGERWVSLCPLEPEAAAARVLCAWCAAGNFAEARNFSDALVRSGATWAADLAALVRLRHALGLAQQGRLDEALAMLS